MHRILIVIALLAAPALAQKANLGPVTTIDSGLISGMYVGEKKDVRAFLGIPYAAPPVGDLRWRPPAPVEPWEGMRECRDFGPACLQPSGFGRSGGHTGNQSEDCLYLNVWAPKSKITTEKLPVMVWIHGGGMTIGAGSLPAYRGEEFARRGVVLITINYRLGPFGFFGHPALSAGSPKKVSGNYGLLDQIAALRWVKRNAATFGGDPNCVTIFGESAGAVSVCCLMASPLAKGLFQRAIAQSGTAVGVKTPLRDETGLSIDLEELGGKLAKKLGVADAEDVAAALRALPAAKIMAVAKPAPVSLNRQRRYFPVIDGWVLPHTPAETWDAGKQHEVPFMIGANADDGGVFTSAIRLRTIEAYRWTAKRLWPAEFEDILAAFPAKTDADVPLVVREIMTVKSFVAPARRLARAHEHVKSPCFSYHFTRVSPRAKKYGAGAAHGFEIPYVFGNHYPWLGLVEADVRLSRVMQDAWIRFARTGNPNGEGLPKWPAYTEKNDTHLEFGDEVRTGTGLLKKKCDLFDHIDRN